MMRALYSVPSCEKYKSKRALISNMILLFGPRHKFQVSHDQQCQRPVPWAF